MNEISLMIFVSHWMLIYLSWLRWTFVFYLNKIKALQRIGSDSWGDDERDVYGLWTRNDKEINKMESVFDKTYLALFV